MPTELGEGASFAQAKGISVEGERLFEAVWEADDAPFGGFLQWFPGFTA